MLTLATHLDRSVEKNQTSSDLCKDDKEEKEKVKEEKIDEKKVLNYKEDAKMLDDGEESKVSPSISKANNICNDIIQQDANVILKSLLKKSSGKLDEAIKVKHNRNVTFNQTVIVFCEELDTQSPSDVFEPPLLGYEDAFTNLQSDNKQELLEQNKPNHQIDSDNNNNNTSALDDNVDGNQHESTKNDSKSRQINNKILLENIERLNRICPVNSTILSDMINESMPDGGKIDFEDYSELDDDYLIKQHLISNQSYICNEAISDFDSDSESSTCFERFITNSDNKGAIKSIEQQENKTELVKSKLNKSTSARMKVSTISSNGHLKRSQTTSNKNNNSDRGQKTDSNQVVPNSSEQISPNNINSAQRQKNDTQLNQKLQDEENRLVNSKSSDDRKNYMIQQNITSNPVDNVRRSMEDVEKQILSRPRQQTNSKTLPDQIKKELVNENRNNPTATIITIDKRSIPTSTTSNIGNNLINTQSQQLNKPTDVIQTQAFSTIQVQQQPACHICRVIESSNLNKTNLNNNYNIQINRSLPLQTNNNDILKAKPIVSSGQKQITTVESQQKLPNNVPNNISNNIITFDQSCSSCREVLARKQNLVPHNVQSSLEQLQPVLNTTTVTRANSTLNGQHAQPATSYQLIHILGQNGNIVKTLSVIRPPQNATQNQTQLNPGARVFITQDGGRLQQQSNANPVTIVGQPKAISTNLSNNNMQRTNLVNQNNNSSIISNSNPQTQYKLVNLSSMEQQNKPIIINGTKNILVQAALSNSSNNNPSSLPQQTNISDIRSQINNNNNSKPQTIYYVRQPLRPHIVSHSTIDQLSSRHNSSSIKSFPDAHEIRRLDGLRGPNVISGHYIDPQINSNNLSQKNSQQVIQKSVKPRLNQTTSNMLKNDGDDFDDPTFGFSNRPAVKVVAVKGQCSTTSRNSILSNNGKLNENVTILKNKINNLPVKQLINRQHSTLDGVRETIAPPAQFAMMIGSQTLDRRYINQQQQQQRSNNSPTKVTIPSTASMSNIHREMVVLDNTSKVKNNSHSLLDQAKIVSMKKELINNDNESTKTKGTLSISFHRWLSNKLPSKQI